MTWVLQNLGEIVGLLVAHLALAVPAILASLVVALPIGRLAFRFPRAGGAVVTASSLLYSVPALPILIMIPVVLGTPLRSSATMIAALTVYGVALLVGSAHDAFGSVPSDARQAANALGFSRRGSFWRVDLPLALPVYVAGARVMAVSTVSLVTIGSLVGIPSLGTLLTDGFQRGIIEEVAAGILATVALAVVTDAVILGVGKALTPWRRTELRPPALVSA